MLYGELVADIMRGIGAQTLSDYGAGKQKLLEALREIGAAPKEYFAYDPVFPEYGPARSADLVCCIDVLEHIEIEYLDSVLDHLKNLINNFGFFAIHTKPAQKVLSDGRNAHLIQAPPSWWLQRIATRLEILQMEPTEVGFWLIVSENTQEAVIAHSKGNDD